MEEIGWGDFERVEIRVGTVMEVEEFPEARSPAYQLLVDFGAAGVKKSSAQITRLYTREELVGKQVIGVLNFPTKGLSLNNLYICVPLAYIFPHGDKRIY